MALLQDQYGRGLRYPLQINGRGDNYVTQTGEALVSADVAHLLAIRGPSADAPGELLWNTELGSGMAALKHRHGYDDMVSAEALMMSADALRRWDRRVRIVSASVEVATESTGVRRRVAIWYALAAMRGGAVQRADVPLKE